MRPLIDPELGTTLFYSSGTLRVIATGSRSQFESMNDAITKGLLRPVVAKAFTFNQALDAFRFYERQSPFGKVVITNDDAQ